MDVVISDVLTCATVQRTGYSQYLCLVTVIHAGQAENNLFSRLFILLSNYVHHTLEI